MRTPKRPVVSLASKGAFTVLCAILALSGVMCTKQGAKPVEPHPAPPPSDSGQAGKVTLTGATKPEEPPEPKTKFTAAERKKQALEFIARAPADSIILSHSKMGPERMDKSNFIFRFCKISSIPPLDISFSSADKWLVEISGEMTLKNIACMLGQPPPKGDKLDLVLAEGVKLDNGKIQIRPKSLKPFTPMGQSRLRTLFEGGSFDSKMRLAVQAGEHLVVWDARANKAILEFEEESPKAAQAIESALKAALTNESAVQKYQRKKEKAKGEKIPQPSAKFERSQNKLTVTSSEVDLNTLVHLALMESYSLPSDSMQPTFLKGDNLQVFKGPFQEKTVRGSLIVFANPQDPEQDYVKRVMAVAGDQVEIKDGQLLINGQPIKVLDSMPDLIETREIHGKVTGKKDMQRIKLDLAGRQFQIYRQICKTDDECTALGQGRCDENSHICLMKDYGPEQVPPDSLFVMGDNWDNSLDSRSFGWVPQSSVVGHAGWILWSMGSNGFRWSRLGITPH